MVRSNWTLQCKMQIIWETPLLQQHGVKRRRLFPAQQPQQAHLRHQPTQQRAPLWEVQQVQFLHFRHQQLQLRLLQPSHQVKQAGELKELQQSPPHLQLPQLPHLEQDPEHPCRRQLRLHQLLQLHTLKMQSRLKHRCLQQDLPLRQGQSQPQLLSLQVNRLR